MIRLRPAWDLGRRAARRQQRGRDAVRSRPRRTPGFPRSPASQPYDLVDGLVGFGVNALEAMPRRSARLLLETIVDRLGDAAVRRSPGLAWRSDPSWIPLGMRSSHLPWNLGVAHGNPGVVALLARVAASRAPGRVREKARYLLHGAVGWLLAQEPSDGAFPPAVDASLTMTAWCYGDPGVAAVLVLAGHLEGEQAWVSAGTRIGLRGGGAQRGREWGDRRLSLPRSRWARAPLSPPLPCNGG